VVILVATLFGHQATHGEIYILRALGVWPRAKGVLARGATEEGWHHKKLGESYYRTCAGFKLHNHFNVK